MKSDMFPTKKELNYTKNGENSPLPESILKWCSPFCIIKEETIENDTFDMV